MTRRGGGMSAAAAAYKEALREINKQRSNRETQMNMRKTQMNMRNSNIYNSYRYVNPEYTRQLYYNPETRKYERDYPPKPSNKNNS